MSLRPTLRAASRALAIRSRPALPRHEALGWSLAKRRYADDAVQKNTSKPVDAAAARRIKEDLDEEAVMDQLEAALANLPKEQPRRKARKGTDEMQQDALAEEAAADDSGITVEQAARELEEAAKANAGPGMKDGLTPSQMEHLYREGSIPPTVSDGDAQRDLEVLASGGLLADSAAADVLGTDEKGRSYKYPLPAPLPENSKLQARYHPVLEQLTNVMMRHGKKSVAQRNMAMILNYLRTAPAPILSTKNPLMAGHPPASHFPFNPVMYLTIVIDSVAPLVKVRYIPGAAGGGRPLEMPGPLAVRQRRRMAFQWILDAVAKKRSTGSGRTQLAHRIANEIIAIAEGRSGVWEKRIAVHKLATATRANLGAQLVKNMVGRKF
ncbi:37S ribosomal protein S7 like [Verticillium longisporum]|nr:37S ribosomal protein S7 like [Verticillium longisporum]